MADYPKITPEVVKKYEHMADRVVEEAIQKTQAEIKELNQKRATLFASEQKVRADVVDKLNYIGFLMRLLDARNKDKT